MGRSNLNSKRARALRSQLFTQQNGICWWCLNPMSLDYLDMHNPGRVAKNYATFEHLITREDGGTFANGNVVLACSRCNCERNRHGNPNDFCTNPVPKAGELPIIRHEVMSSPSPQTRPTYAKLLICNE